MYDPTLGRFLQRDPMGPTSDPNLYEFTASNPTFSLDAFGLQAKPAAPAAQPNPAAPRGWNDRTDFRPNLFAHVAPFLLGELVKRSDALCGRASATWKVRTLTPGLYRIRRTYRYLVWACVSNCKGGCLVDETPLRNTVVSEGRIEILPRTPGLQIAETDISIDLPGLGNRSCSSKGFQDEVVSLFGQQLYGTRGWLVMSARVDWDCCGPDKQTFETKKFNVG